MKIKIAILEKDKNYLNRIVSVFTTKYTDNFEIYSFTEEKIAVSAVKDSRIDVFIISDSCDVDTTEIPSRCGIAYFVDSQDVENYKGERAICRFQKADLIYKQILGVYSEVSGAVSAVHAGDNQAKLIAFTSPGGGVGTSAYAAAASVYFASLGKKTLYLNLEKLGSSDLYFTGEGQSDLSDIIFALKSKKGNLTVKLESCVKQAANGVYFFSQPKVALDMYELSQEDIRRLVDEICILGVYDYIILDMDFSMDEATRKFLRGVDAVVWVSDGTTEANLKIQRAYEALDILEQEQERPITSNISLIYNKFSSKTGVMLENLPLRTIGGSQRYEHATCGQILEQLSAKNLYDKILNF